MQAGATTMSHPKFSLLELSGLQLEAVALFQMAKEGTTAKFLAKTSTLADMWKIGFATKKSDYFEVVFEDDPKNILKIEFGDEGKSLLSVNLWDLG